MRDLIIEKLLEYKRDYSRTIWHWGKDKIRIQELALRIEYNRLTDKQLLEKYDEMIDNFYMR